jgi:hypothetical protein
MLKALSWVARLAESALRGLVLGREVSRRDNVGAETIALRDSGSEKRPPYQIRNPKLEIRNKSKNSNPNYQNGTRIQFARDFVFFGHLNLFRISDFEFGSCRHASKISNIFG